MSTLNWDDNEAVVRAAVPSAYETPWGNINTSVHLASGMAGGSWTLADNWAAARQHPTVRAWEQENRPKDWEEAKRKVQGRWPDARFAEMDVVSHVYRILVTKQGHAWRQQTISDPFSTSQEAAAWIDAASKLEPVGEEPTSMVRISRPAREELYEKLMVFFRTHGPKGCGEPSPERDVWSHAQYCAMALFTADPSPAREARETTPEKVIWHIEMRTTDGSWYAFPFWEDEAAIRKVYEQSEYPEIRLMRDVVISTIAETRTKEASNG